MTKMEFFGCAFLAYGTPFALFLITIVRDPLRVIVFMASAFFWLVSLLVSSLWWYAVVPLRDDVAFGLVFSVLFQEAARFGFYFLLRKAEQGLKKVWQEEAGGSTVTLVNNKHLMAYVSGMGFGVISGAFALINVLADMTGPGTIGIHGDPQLFFVISSLLTLCMILLHTFWGVIFFDGLSKQKYVQPIVVVLLHMLVSCMTLLNQMDHPQYIPSSVVAYVVLVGSACWAFIIAGGSISKLTACVTTSRNYDFDSGTS